MGHDGTVVPDERRSQNWRTRAQRLADDAAGVAGPIWNDRRIGSVAAVGAGALWGAPAGWWTPRGPLTTGQAIWSIVVSLAVGATAGIIVRSRWAMLATPVAFAAVFELVRAGTDGPTVDRISTSTYGLIAFVVGRGFHALISLLPMAYGASLGAGIARQLAPASSGTMHSRRWWLYTKRGSAVLAGIGLLAFTVMLARPASTDPIVDADGNRIPGSIAELTTVDVNGHDLTMLIRGHSVDNPVLLFLAGGPGGSEMGAMRRHVPELEEHFTVVTWDQRGTGHAYGQLDPTDTLTLDSAIDDTLAVETALANEQDVYTYDHSPNSEGQGQMSENLFVEEYALIDQIHILGGFMDTFSVLYPQLQDIDFRETATDLEIPMFFVQGALEADGRADVFADWYPMVDAPIKDLVVLDTSGHRPLFEQPDEFVEYMTNTVLARTADTD